MGKTMMQHEHAMERFLDRLHEDPGQRRGVWLRIPKGVTIYLKRGSKGLFDTHYTASFRIASRGRTGAADRLALRNILARGREVRIHQNWLRHM